jgi:hypothetical protein
MVASSIVCGLSMEHLPNLSRVRVGRCPAASNNKSLALTKPPALAIKSLPGSPAGNVGFVKSRDLSLLYLTFNAVNLLLSIRKVQQPL